MTEDTPDKPKKKGYDFLEVEAKLKDFWDENKTYKFDIKDGKVYSIDTPPPTVSGKMHIGHAFSYAQQDFVARYRRMREGVFYPFGTDDNGLPTERLVERLKGIKSTEMSRAEFIKICLETLSEIIGEFIQDWKNLGISCDYDVCYSTIDDNSRKLSQLKFIELLNGGEVYKEEFPTIWCPECQTAIAQAELEDKEFPSKFSTLRFKVKDSGEDLLIATTRPELLSACVAVFVHPDDDRFKEKVGRNAIVPLFNFEVPILADPSADPEKGTGVLMVCSYGDKFDVEAIKKHNLEPRIVFNKDGTANYDGYEGLKVRDARKKILEDLSKADLITEQKDITHSVNVHDKCGTEIEFLPTAQWFIKILDKKEKLIEQAKKINWYPEYMYKRYENWVNGLEWDWNISRNRHFGIPIPVWECEKCSKMIVASESELPVDPTGLEKKCPDCGENAKPETMVLDTWATSSISPQIASSLVGGKVAVPFSLRPQAHDIIRTWAFYTIVRSYLHEDKLPWNEIMISGNVSLKGEKMSKSKGNVVDPKEVMDKYGADALRFWASGSSLGSDLDYQEDDLIAGSKMVNKIFNASNFVFMNLEGYQGEKPEEFEEIDELFLKKLDFVTKKITEHFDKYEYSKAKQEIERFFWKDFCDNYLEIVKKRVYNAEGDEKLSAQYTLYNSLLSIMKMIAPIMPFVTEEVYQNFFKDTQESHSIHVSDWPTYTDVKPEEFKRFEDFCEILSSVRQEKTKAQKSMKAQIRLTVPKGELGYTLEDLANVTGAVEVLEGDFSVEFV